MQIEERVVGGVTILDLSGKMTLGEGDELLREKIASLVNAGQKNLLLNLDGVRTFPTRRAAAARRWIRRGT